MVEKKETIIEKEEIWFNVHEHCKYTFPTWIERQEGHRTARVGATVYVSGPQPNLRTALFSVAVIVKNSSLIYVRLQTFFTNFLEF